MNLRHRTPPILLSLLLAASAVTAQATPSDDQPRPFAANPAIEEATLVIARAPGTQLRRLERVVDRIFSKKHGLGFEYASHPTFTAAEAFEHGRGNCLSLVNLFVAMARSAGIRAYFVEVEDFETFHRVGESVVRSTHVVGGVTLDGRLETVDFYPGREKSYRNMRIISDDRGAAHYYNAVAAEAMLTGDLAAAEPLFRRALALDPTLIEGWNNLALLAQRHGRTVEAIALVEKALQQDPEFLPAIENLSGLYRVAGRTAEARATTARVLELKTRNPFYLLDRAREHFAAADLDTADRLLERAGRIEKRISEIHLLRGRIALVRGDEKKANRHFARAVRFADERPRLFQQNLEGKVDKLLLASR
ncbi:MAG: tetratricopeptide repeat protein [Acidobacteriota bacterium]